MSIFDTVTQVGNNTWIYFDRKDSDNSLRTLNIKHYHSTIFSLDIDTMTEVYTMTGRSKTTSIRINAARKSLPATNLHIFLILFGSFFVKNKKYKAKMAKLIEESENV